jgi:hypothetical protein
MTLFFRYKGKEEAAVCPWEIRKLIFKLANRRFFLHHSSPQKMCHPELILPDIYHNISELKRMSEGSQVILQYSLPG